MRGTARDPEAAAEPAPGCEMYRFDREHPLPPAAFDGITHILVSIPPDAAGRSRCSTRMATTSPRLPASPGSAICRRPGCMATAAASGSTRRPSCARAASAAGGASRPRPDGSICGAAGACRSHVFRLAAIYGPGRSPFDGFARRHREAHRQSRGRSSRASMSRISPACSPPRSRGRVPARSTMSATTRRPPPEAVVAYAAGLLGLPRAAAGAVRGSRAVADGAQLL